MRNFHLQPGSEGWELIREADNKVLGAYATREEAIQRASEILRLRTGALKIHGGDGTIEEERDFPRPAGRLKPPG